MQPTARSALPTCAAALPAGTVDEANVPWPLPVQYIEALALVQAAYAHSPEDGKEALVKHAWVSGGRRRRRLQQRHERQCRAGCLPA